MNMKWMNKDAANIVGYPKPHIVLLQKMDSLLFPQDVLDLLYEKLVTYSKLKVHLVYGNESVRDMVQMFNPAGAIVGFYLDLFVNDLFASYPHCSTQVSTFYDLNLNR